MSHQYRGVTHPAMRENWPYQNGQNVSRQLLGAFFFEAVIGTIFLDGFLRVYGSKSSDLF